jgi:hypothetical protein
MANLARTQSRGPIDCRQPTHDVGRTLGGIVFRKRTVSSLDIARLVAPVVAIRDAEETRAQGAVIGSLIEETLLEFGFLEASENDSRVDPDEPLDIQAFENA